MFDKGIAVVAVTRRGVETALKIQKALELANLPCTVFAPKKYSQNGVIAIEKNFADFMKEIYKQSGRLSRGYGYGHNYSYCRSAD